MGRKRTSCGSYGISACATHKRGRGCIVAPLQKAEVLMNTRRTISRRSFLGQITGGVAGIGSLSLVTGQARAYQVTDSDRVINDQPGSGRGQRSGITDSDPGDAVGNGTGGVRSRPTGPSPDPAPRSPYEEDDARGRRRTSGITDSDPTDPAGDGRGTPNGVPRSPYDEPEVRQRGSGITDSDPGDPVGFGRGGARPRCTDSDTGPGADPSSQGRRC